VSPPSGNCSNYQSGSLYSFARESIFMLNRGLRQEHGEHSESDYQRERQEQAWPDHQHHPRGWPAQPVLSDSSVELFFAGGEVFAAGAVEREFQPGPAQ
jgi:hypothetical protein